MGYWVGSIFGDTEGKGLVWGDQPADKMADVVEVITNIFLEDVGRKPTKAELREGLEFHLRALDTLEEDFERCPSCQTAITESNPLIDQERYTANDFTGYCDNCYDPTPL